MKALEPSKIHSEPGRYYDTPMEVWGFKTPAQEGVPVKEAAKNFLKANCELLKLDENLKGIRYKQSIESLGAHHLIFQQRHLNTPVHRAYVTVHMDLKGRVYMCKCRAIPRPMLPARTDYPISANKAECAAYKWLRFSKRDSDLQDTGRKWYPWENKLLPAWRVRIRRKKPREEWIVYVQDYDFDDGVQVLDGWDNLSHAARKNYRALVFDPSPVTELGEHRDLLSPGLRPRSPPWEAYRVVTLEGLKGNGYLDGTRVSTDLTKNRVYRRDGDFMIRAGKPGSGFEEVMAYHHIDSAIRYIESLGYRGKKAIFKKPLRVNVDASQQDNAWYSPGDRSLNFGTGYINEAEDAETILHELGHAIQDFICHDFGQRDEAAAMGEGFGDYFAASFFAERKPEAYRPCVITWDGLLIGLRKGESPACLRRVDRPLTFDDFVDNGKAHLNGEIWSAILWDIRRHLGREIADTVILESHFELDPFTKFERGARAIVHADRNLYRGRHEKILKQVFKDRRVPVAV